MQTPLEEIPLDKPSLLEDMLTFLSLYTTDKELFNSYEKDRGLLMKGKEDLEAGRLQLSTLDEKGVPLVMGLLLLHLKFQTESLLASSVYEKSCKVIVETKGSTALGTAFAAIIDELHPKRQACVRAFFKYLHLVQSHKAINGFDSIALATRFGTFLLRPPSGQEPTLPRVKLMGALAVLIESFPRAGGGSGIGRKSPSPSLDGTPPPMRKDSSAPGGLTAVPSAAPATRTAVSLSIAGVQVSEVARSAVVVIDSSQKTLAKLKANVEKETDAVKLADLIKRLKHLEQVVGGQTAGRSSQQEYSI